MPCYEYKDLHCCFQVNICLLGLVIVLLMCQVSGPFGLDILGMHARLGTAVLSNVHTQQRDSALILEHTPIHPAYLFSCEDSDAARELNTVGTSV